MYKNSVIFVLNKLIFLQFGIDDLKSYCKQYMLNNFCNSMILPGFEAAEVLNDVELKKVAWDFVSE
jgi:hypothetical protein